MKKFFILFAVSLALTACTNTPNKKHPPIIIEKDINAFDILIGQFANNIENIWGRQEILIAGTKDYVKYTDNYKTRSHINFDSGVITVETLEQVDTLQQLRQTIISTLLMGDNPDSINLYSDSDDVSISQEPFLFGQVVDQENQPIRWEWRATRFADYLLETHLQRRQSGLKTIWGVNIRLVANHVDQRAHKYLPYVRKAAKKYHVDERLILAIMQIESSFNPYAVSRANALGLMQVVSHTAGRDVFAMQGRSGQPSRSYLFDPEKNIDTGTAYLAILQNQYLADINHPKLKHYATITAYNAGAGSVLRVFSDDKAKAIQLINKMTPEQLYKKLTNDHPSSEARRYLYKVDSVYRNNSQRP